MFLPLQVLSTAHSHLSLDGQDLEGRQHLGVVVRDSKQKGFFIRIVDPEVGAATPVYCWWSVDPTDVGRKSRVNQLAAFVWSQGKKVLGEKRLTRNFQYDTPEDLVMTYLSEVWPLHGLWGMHGISTQASMDVREWLNVCLCGQLSRREAIG